ncbi:hypothetical protein F4553_003555 [Allocatelliglobosispora scoriae]|uniref:Uncharacterized protein n=1 Tax=Allocatelliglobosispora scoriae TaxID=643052 RepID=A0A841BS05_9ACTN|nr:hypothetical protein [Allocatelliglobosispora scoriae]MBB5870176.1 hypothetical protein [Allocatelliglobosispora scoriae]
MADTPAQPPNPASPPTQPLNLPRPGNGLARLALVVAAASLLLAVIASGLAVIALSRSGAGTPAAASQSPGGPPASPSAKASVLVPPSPPAPTSPAPALDVLAPGAVYSSKYTDQQLIPPVNQSSDAYIDLDEPRAYPRSTDTIDIVVGQSYDSSVPYIDLGDNVDGAIVPAGTAPDAAGCAELIRTAPVSASASVPAQRNLVMCIATSRSQASREGIKQRMVVLTVVSLTTAGRPTIKLTAWEIPG